MGMYRCNWCEGYFCSHETNCYEDPKDEYELICEGCDTEKPIEEEKEICTKS